MAHHASHDFHRISPKPREKGAAHTAVHHNRRHKSLEGKYGVVGTGATITGANIDSTSSSAPGVSLDGTGLHAYNSAGTETVLISAADGSITVEGTGTITGGTIRTSSVPPYAIFDASGIRAYNVGGVLTFNLDASSGNLTVLGSSTITGGTVRTSSGTGARVIMDSSGLKAYNASNTITLTISASDGSLTVSGTSTITGGTIQTAASGNRVVMDIAGLRAYSSLQQTVNIGSDGSFSLSVPTGSLVVSSSNVSFSSSAASGTGARVVIDGTGIKGYNASNQQEFLLDSASGLISATGVLTANPGSSVPWQTTGFFVGGGNLLSNASVEDPTTTTQLLYTTTGATVTGGSFTLRWGTNTVTGSIPYNAKASDVQSALSTSGVLPAGVSVTCTGGPLPGNPITITVVGYSTIAPPIITVFSQSITGGSMVVGAIPISWIISAGAADFIGYGSSFHGGQVLRLTGQNSWTRYPGPGTYPGAGTYPGDYVATGPVVTQTVGPYGLVAGTKYTLSGYFQAAIATRPPQLSITWKDILGGTVGTTSVTASWNTSPNWQRLVLMGATLPPFATRQKITITGGPTGGSLTLTYNGQTTAAIAYNATAAQVLSALQALSNVGSSGAAYATGGPLPGNPVTVSFISPPAAAPTTMTATSSLTGGTPAISITNMQTVSIGVSAGVPSGTSGEIYYADAIQLEVGDAPTAFAPRGDEILANTIQANMINVGQLSAITANLGNITAGTINGVTITGSTITGATVQSSATDARMAFDTSGIWSTDAFGSRKMQLSAGGMILPVSGWTGGSAITWKLGSTSGSTLGTIFTNSVMNVTTQGPFTNATTGSGGSLYLVAEDANTVGQNSATYIALSSTTMSDAQNQVVASVSNAAASATSQVVLIDGTGQTKLPNFTTSGSGTTLSANAVNFSGAPGLYPSNYNGTSWSAQSSYYVGQNGTSIITNATSFTAGFSDAAFKHSVRPLHNALAKLKSLEAHRFTWARGPDQGQDDFGFVAQEVEPLFPEAVVYHDSWEYPHLGKLGTVRYDRMVAPLWNACRAILERVERLERILGRDNSEQQEALGQIRFELERTHWLAQLEQDELSMTTTQDDLELLSGRT